MSNYMAWRNIQIQIDWYCATSKNGRFHIEQCPLCKGKGIIYKTPLDALPCIKCQGKGIVHRG